MDKEEKIINILCYLFILHPLFWLIGIDQLVWLTFPIFLFLYAILNGIKLRFPFILVLFLIVHILSGFSIPFESHAWFYLPLYFYKLLAILCALITFLFIYNLGNNILLFEKIMKFVIFSIAISVLTSLLITFVFKKIFIFLAPLKYILPKFLLSRGIIQEMLTKSLCEYGIFFDKKICRISGFFYYPNTLADAILVGVAFVLYFMNYRRIYIFIFLLFICGLIFTTSRAGITSFLIAFWIYIIFRIFKNFYISLLFIFFSLLIFYLCFLTSLSFNSYISNKFKIVKEKVLGARTIKGRENIYEKTWRYIKKRPLLGWGTNRRFYEFETLNIKIRHPYLGSHSGYLSILFRTGIIGLSVFVLFLIKLGMIISKKLLYEQNEKVYRLSCALLFGYIALSLHLLFLDNMHDFVLLNLNWTLWGLIAALENIEVKCNYIK